MMEEKKEIVPIEAEGKIVSPIISAENAEKAMQAYQELCAAVLIPWDDRKVANGVIVQESDYQRIPVRRKEGGRWITEYRDFPKKSAWRKLGKFYKISDEVVGEPKRVDRSRARTVELGVTLCYRAIVKYYGKRALERFKEKREKAKENFKEVYENEAWEKFGKSLDELIEKYSEPPEKLPDGIIATLEKAHEVELDGKYTKTCPECHQSFNYDRTFIDRYVRCRHCRTLMLLKKADSWEL